jgi:hypothetical protein
MFELGVRIMDQKIQSQMQTRSAATPAGATPGGEYLLSAVSSPFYAGAGASTFLGAQREALSKSTADAASRVVSTPQASAGASASTPAGEGAGRRLF